MRYTLALTYGDPSRDGHGMSETDYFTSNYSSSDVQKAMVKAEKYYKHCISLPMYPTLTEQEQQFVIENIIKFYS